MANGSDSDDFVVLSKVKPGMKREFAFALKAQAEICGSLARTRGSQKARNEADNNISSCKRLRVVEKSKNNNQKAKSGAVDKLEEEKAGGLVSEEEAKSDVVDVEDGKSGVVESKKEERKSGVMNVYTRKKSGSGSKLGVERSENAVVELGEEEAVVVKSEVEENMAKVEKCGGGLELGSKDMSGAEGRDVVDDVNKVDDRVMVVSRTPTPFRRFTRSALNKPDVNDENEVNVGSPMVITRPASGKYITKRSSKLKELLESGILEGLPVTYLKGPKGEKVAAAEQLKGVVKGSGILCFCSDCKGEKVVTPAVFELHAGSTYKRPPENIYLASGHTLRDVMNAWKNSTLDSLEESIRDTIGSSSIKSSAFCLNCKGSITMPDPGKVMLLCHSCAVMKNSQAELCAIPADISDSSERKVNSSLLKSSERIMKIGSSRSKTQGRLTRKDLRLHKLVFESDVLPDGTEVAYYARGEKLLVGYKKEYGIYCTHCNTLVSPSQFEAHAGWASRRKPYLHIYTSNGVSLHELSLLLSKERKLSTSENDDLCSICADGGNLLCCDGCPRAFHTECVPLSEVPVDKWYCRYCQNMFQKEKFVEHNANAIAAGRVIGVDPMEEITKRCIRIIKSPDTEVGGCSLCRKHDFCRSGFGPRTVIFCDQCENEYHVGCLKDHGRDNLEEIPAGKWFCCHQCEKINLALEMAVKCGGDAIPDDCLIALRRRHDNLADLDIRWRLLCGKTASPDEKKSLLARAVAIFHERFDPISDNSVRGDLIPAMVYGGKKNQDFSGMHCAVLTVNQEVVCAGVLRIFGQEVAELPLVATRTDHQGKGYFNCLFSCMESFLQSVDVKNLVLPSAEEAESIWTNKFGFCPLAQEEINKYRRFYSILIFEGTSVLQKPVKPCQ